MSPSEERHAWTVEPTEAGVRLDLFLVRRGVLGTRSQVQQVIRAGRVAIDSKPAKSGAILRSGQHVEVVRSLVAPTGFDAEPIPLDVVYEDDWLLVINKPAGLVVHPAPGHRRGTLVNALLYRWQGPREGMDPARLGLVHRLDKDTSGILVIAKDVRTLAALSAQFKQREVRKEYLALAWGRFPQRSGTIDAPIGRHPVHRKRMAVRSRGRAALTRYAVEETFADISLVRLMPVTGRTHQIRVHLAAAGHPIIGDPQYAGSRRHSAVPMQRQALHAESITIHHPQTHDVLRLSAPLPEDFAAALIVLREAQGSKNRG